MSRLACACLATLLLGCMSYGPLSEGGLGGYRDRRLSPGIHEVVFLASRSPQELSDLALLRAAQLTLEQGYGHFVIDPTWTWLSEGRARYVLQLVEPAPGLDPASLYDAAEVQARLLEAYRSLGVRAVARAPRPLIHPCQ